MGGGEHEEDEEVKLDEWPDAGEIWPESKKKARFYDNVTGKPLEDWRVLKARKEELEYFRKEKVYVQVPRTKCWEVTGKGPIRVRWVDVNKGDDENPDYRSRLVAMEFRVRSNNDFFSGTPPLEALRYLCSR